MRQRFLNIVYAGLTTILLAAAISFAVYVSGGHWVVKGSGSGIHNHDGAKKQLRLRRGKTERTTD